MTDVKEKSSQLAANNAVNFQVDNDLTPLVDPGTYDVMLDKFQTALMFQGKASKLIMWFTVVSYGKFYGVRLPRYYNVIHLIGKPQVGGRFKVSPKGDFLREYFTLFHHEGTRLDRLPMTRFDGVTIRAKVETVKFARGTDIPKPLRYSRISRLLKVIEE